MEFIDAFKWEQWVLDPLFIISFARDLTPDKSRGSFEDACQHEEDQIQDKDEGSNEG